jgi:hypothetical protein
MAANRNQANKVWRSIKDNDVDSNGFLGVEELENCFREHFSYELDSKSLVYFFRRYSTDHDKDLINYRLIKNILTEGIKEVAIDGTPS